MSYSLSDCSEQKKLLSWNEIYGPGLNHDRGTPKLGLGVYSTCLKTCSNELRCWCTGWMLRNWGGATNPDPHNRLVLARPRATHFVTVQNSFTRNSNSKQQNCVPVTEDQLFFNFFSSLLFISKKRHQSVLVVYLQILSIRLNLQRYSGCSKGGRRSMCESGIQHRVLCENIYENGELNAMFFLEVYRFSNRL